MIASFVSVLPAAAVCVSCDLEGEAGQQLKGKEVTAQGHVVHDWAV